MFPMGRLTDKDCHQWSTCNLLTRLHDSRGTRLDKNVRSYFILLALICSATFIIAVIEARVVLPLRRRHVISYATGSETVANAVFELCSVNCYPHS
ncbi:hypothetical protein POTOM_016642 [Populus tomentosa]|uniref:Uncharacterized protein n=1 Tax=Populus tomentosa TaxID=118781 RepID=A0A8X7ZZ05_POPTO|nr:hypothetical protein POTOM_016642 [Populus tomentosa]